MPRDATSRRNTDLQETLSRAPRHQDDTHSDYRLYTQQSHTAHCVTVQRARCYPTTEEKHKPSEHRIQRSNFRDRRRLTREVGGYPGPRSDARNKYDLGVDVKVDRQRAGGETGLGERKR